MSWISVHIKINGVQLNGISETTLNTESSFIGAEKLLNMQS